MEFPEEEIDLMDLINKYEQIIKEQSQLTIEQIRDIERGIDITSDALREWLTPAEIALAEKRGLQPRITELQGDYDYIHNRLKDNPDNQALLQRFEEIYSELIYLYTFIGAETYALQFEETHRNNLIQLPSRDWDSIMDFLSDFRKHVMAPLIVVRRFLRL